jgi:drug/metabolite transporter (DMT)-like permease
LKLGSRQTRKEAWRLYLNGYTLTAYCLLIVVTLLALYVYRNIPLKAALMFMPLTLVLIYGLSYWFLGERFTKKQLAGAVMILIGIVVLTLRG